MIEELKQSNGFHYLATPYSKYPGGIHHAFVEACRASAWLIKQGVKIYCPIAHTHAVCQFGEHGDPLNHEIWLPVDKPFMDAAESLIVCQMESWETSYGVKWEIDYFLSANKPVRYLEWE